jgi:hypothetical protein
MKLRLVLLSPDFFALGKTLHLQNNMALHAISMRKQHSAVSKKLYAGWQRKFRGLNFSFPLRPSQPLR